MLSVIGLIAIILTHGSVIVMLLYYCRARSGVCGLVATRLHLGLIVAAVAAPRKLAIRQEERKRWPG